MFFKGQQFADVFLTHKFRMDHVMVVGSHEDMQQAKKLAEQRFLARGIAVSTLIIATPEELRLLYEEVMRNQAAFRKDSKTPYTTQTRFQYFERTCKRAVLHTRPTPFECNVRKDGNMFKIHHLVGML